jgi:peptidyl-prolyl cis-trans isomerase SurA
MGGAVALARAAEPAPIELADRVLAIVADAIITTQQVENRVGRYESSIASKFGKGTQMYNQQLNRMGANELDTLVEQQLILHDFKSTGFNIPETLIDEYIQDDIRLTYGTDRVRFTKELKSRGLTFEQFRKTERDNLIINEMVRKNVPEPIISPHKVEEYYNANRDKKYTIGDEVKTRVIILSQSANEEPGAAKRLAQEILSKIKAGVPFEEMARINSDGPQRTEGGENGWLESSALADALKDPVTKLKAGECSEVIETPTACFLILLEDRRPAHYTPLNDVRGVIEHELALQEKARVHDQWIGRLKAKTFVRWFKTD